MGFNLERRGFSQYHCIEDSRIKSDSNGIGIGIRHFLTDARTCRQKKSIKEIKKVIYLVIKNVKHCNAMHARHFSMTSNVISIYFSYSTFLFPFPLFFFKYLIFHLCNIF